MEQNEIIRGLSDPRLRKRLSTLAFLEKSLCVSQEAVGCNYSTAIIKALTIALLETEVESTKCRCLFLLNQLLPCLKDNLGSSFAATASIVLGYFVYPQSSIRLFARALWFTYAQLNSQDQLVVDQLVCHGLKSSNSSLRTTVASELLCLLPSDFSKQPDSKLQHLVQALVEVMLQKKIKFATKRNFFETYDHLKERIGAERFNRLLNNTTIASSKGKFLCLGGNLAEWKNNFDSNQYKHLFPNDLFNSIFRTPHNATTLAAVKRLGSHVLLELSRINLQKISKAIYDLILFLFLKQPPMEAAVATSLFQLLSRLMQAVDYNVEKSAESIVACVAAWVAVEQSAVQLSLLQTCLVLARVTSIDLVVWNILKYLHVIDNYPLKTSLVNQIIFFYLNHPSHYHISTDAEACADEHTHGFRGSIIRSILTCLISSSPQLRLASLECLAALLEGVKTPQNDFFLKRVFFSTISNQLEFLMGEDFTEEDKSFVYMAISMRLSRNRTPAICLPNYTIKYIQIFQTFF